MPSTVCHSIYVEASDQLTPASAFNNYPQVLGQIRQPDGDGDSQESGDAATPDVAVHHYRHDANSRQLQTVNACCENRTQADTSTHFKPEDRLAACLDSEDTAPYIVHAAVQADPASQS